ncbi:MAG TPA: quinate 5-dehydrogenase [Caldisericia bacterium]|nr:quinate 5-dehydrogenase [Caldisericia bacterium]HRV75576.1 quinate 5-dehydrogenase [Caldisericia bacterium]
MKKIVSVSLGSSSRDHTFETELLGEKFEISRVGTDGSPDKMMEMFEKLDGEVDAFGMGGGDIYMRPGKRTYIMKDPYKWAKAAKTKPVCDGAYLKAILEPMVVDTLFDMGILSKEQKVLVMTAVDRYFLAKVFSDHGCECTFGDLAFSLDIPLAIRSLRMIGFLAATLMPIISKVPYSWLYPLGEKQKEPGKKPNRFFKWAEVVAGDLHYIWKNMPPDMNGKIVVTNTTTEKNREEFKKRGVKLLATFTPNMGGRTFGANVMEAVFSSIIGKHPKDITEQEYRDLIGKLDMKPNIYELAKEE